MSAPDAIETPLETPRNVFPGLDIGDTKLHKKGVEVDELAAHGTLAQACHTCPKGLVIGCCRAFGPENVGFPRNFMAFLHNSHGLDMVFSHAQARS